ncbi:hypothetical protein CPLU01_14524 [Colletotrichum plurivorum]|uniref:Uncharacterized protein n=1 Tax=Colletotrichum plurivorum TaxID=2175906 RepID=A0A8H6JJX0_9PEZI|nr:hypothetical protein CPLU01_14524 [Colletotrichum plurivorum]
MPAASTKDLADIAETLKALYKNYKRETDLLIGPWERTFEPGAREVLEALDAGELTRPQLEKYILALNTAFCSMSKRYGVLRLTLTHLAGNLSNHLRRDVEDALEDEKAEAIRASGRRVDWDATMKKRREPVVDALEKTLRFERRESGVAEEEVQLFRRRMEDVLKRGARVSDTLSETNREQRRLDAERNEVTGTLCDVLGAHMDFRVPVLPSAEEKEKEKQEQKEEKGKESAGRPPLFDVGIHRPDELSAVRKAALFAVKAALLCQVYTPPSSPGGTGPPRSRVPAEDDRGPRFAQDYGFCELVIDNAQVE